MNEGIRVKVVNKTYVFPCGGIDNDSQEDGERFALLGTPDGIGLCIILAIRP